MSWLSDLAGRAENILNKIDQNAANVLKSDTEQLLEVKSNGNSNEVSGSPSIKTIVSNNSLKLLRTKNPESIRNGKTLLNVSNEDTNQSSLSNASNSSRRSSWSSRTEGITVIEYPIATATVGDTVSNDMTTSIHSVHSNQSVEDDRNELAAIKIMLAQMKSERDQFKMELDELVKEISAKDDSKLIADLEQTCRELSSEREQLNDKFEETAAISIAYQRRVSELEATVTKLHQSEVELSERLNSSKSEVERAVLELQQYRTRAQNTLQMKDQLIEELKGGSYSPTVNSDTDQSPQKESLEIQTLQSERDGLSIELQTLRNQIDGNKQYLASMETRLNDTEVRAKEREEFLNNLLQQEKFKCIQLEDHLQVSRKELNAVREEMMRQQTNFSIKANESEKELRKLKAKVSQSNYTGMSSKSFDDRINSLTQSLVQKQNSLESITAERNAIRIQLEKLENQHRSTLVSLRQQQPVRVINMNDTDDDKSQLPNFMQENPFDTRVARRVKRAYSTLDSAGIRLGVFMRRYPLIRVLALVYVTVLHLWVMIVLFSSTPA